MTNKPPFSSVSVDSEKLEFLRVKLKTFSFQKMEALIRSLQPEEEMYAGRELFKRILAKKSEEKEEDQVARLVDFIIDARYIVADEGKILPYDFEHDPHDPGDAADVLPHGEMLNKLSPHPAIPRRKFLATTLRTSATAALGGYFLSSGLVGVAEKAIGENAPHKNPTEAKYKFFNWLSDRVKNITPEFETLLGLIVINEGLEKWNEEKFDQISNAVVEFTKRAEREVDKNATPISR